MKTFGYFDDKNREYVITNPATPFPWINYLGNEDFFGLISNTAGGYDFYKDAKFRRITRYRYNGVPMDAGGRYFYINDGEAIWSPGWKPCKTPLDSYECRHGMNYTRITGSKNGVEASVLFFVPLKTWAEVQKLTLRNTTDEVKRLKLFSFTEWCLWNAATDMENFQRNWSTGEVEIENGSTIYHKTEYKERRNHYAFYALTNAKANGYDTDRESFIGLYNGFEAPQCVVAGKPSNSVAHGWSPIASHYVEVELKPGESKDFIFVLGYEENEQEQKFAPLSGKTAEPDRNTEGTLITSLGELDHTIINKDKAHAVIQRFSTIEAVDAAFEELRQMWDGLLSKFTVKSGDERLDRMVNIWNQYQCMITFCFSRSASFFESGVGRGMGFRDSNQDLVGFVHQVPSRARQRIIDIASTQFPDGGCYHQYQPLTKRGNNDIGGGFNDDPCWLIFGTVAYIKETGDFSILDEMVPWDNEPGTEVTLFEHLRISFNHVVENLGPHMLPLIGRADWNDCLNLNCFSWDPNESFQTTENNSEGSKAESLMIAGLFVLTGKQYVELCQEMAKRGHNDGAAAYTKEADRAQGCIDAMVEAVKKHGWDGASVGSSWVKLLNQGTTRPAVLNKLLASAEFKTRCQKLGILWDTVQSTAVTQYTPWRYLQGDSRWGSVRIGSYTIARTGCVPTSIAMALSGIFNTSIYPDTVARWLYNNTQEYNRIMHGGSGAANLYAAKAWNASAYGIDSASALTNALARGYIVTAIVGPGTFTGSGTTHEIVLWGSSAGSCNVYDPLGKTGKYSISSIWSQRSFDSYDLRGGYVFYAIYK